MWAVLYLSNSSMFRIIFASMNCWHKYRSNLLRVFQWRIQNPAKHLRWSILWKQWMAKSLNYFRKSLHLRCLTWFWIRLWCSAEELFWKTTDMESCIVKVVVAKRTSLQYFLVNFVNIFGKFVKHRRTAAPLSIFET